jgi:hypothetical protein
VYTSPPNPPIALLRRSSSTTGRRPAFAPSVTAPRVVGPAANDAAFEVGDQDHTVLRLRDLHIAPTPLFFAMLACAVPLLMLGVAAQSLESATIGALLLSAALGCLWHGVETIRGLELRCGAPLPCFAGDQVMVDLEVTNPAGRTRWDIAVTLGLTAKPAGNGWIDVGPWSRQQVLMPLVADGRGRQGLPPIRLETRHPFGLVGVSAFWAPRRHLTVTERPALPRV